MRAVILAGGKGTRLRPLTETRPKPLLPFAGDAFAVGLLRRLDQAGCTHATFLVGHDAQPFAPVQALAEALDIAVDVVTEPEPLDTAGGARDLIRGGGDGPFVVCNGDILTDLDYAGLVASHRAGGATATLALTRVEDTSTFGVVDVDAGCRVRAFVEKPPPGTVAADTVNAGTYVLERTAFDRCPVEGPLSFERAVFPALLEGGDLVLGIVADSFWMDLGTPERYLAGHRAVLGGECAWPLGPDFLREGSVLVHRDADVAADAVLGDCVVVCAGARVAAGAYLTRSAVFEDARIGADARVDDAIVGEAATVAAGAAVTGVVVAPGATVG
ncbi:MAG: NTP transferase domain-containing protein [Nitriliruptorales bacterium]|nr:NTP transferase domain-containing protein [Nitriliruptorales bacterium]